MNTSTLWSRCSLIRYEEMLLSSVKRFVHSISLDKVLNDLQIIFKG